MVRKTEIIHPDEFAGGLSASYDAEMDTPTDLQEIGKYLRDLHHDLGQTRKDMFRLHEQAMNAFERHGEQIDRLSEQIDRRGEQIDRLSEQIDRRGEQIDRLSEQTDRRGLQIDRLSEQMDRRGLQIDRLSEQMDRRGLQIDRLSEQLDRRGAQIDRLSEQLDRRGEQIDRLSAQIERHGEQLHHQSEDFQKLHAEMQRLREEMLHRHEVVLLELRSTEHRLHAEMVALNAKTQAWMSAMTLAMTGVILAAFFGFAQLIRKPYPPAPASPPIINMSALEWTRGAEAPLESPELLLRRSDIASKL